MQIKEGLKLVGLESDEARCLQGVVLEEARAGSATSITTLSCVGLLCCAKKEIERATFDAINSNSLVYDGRSVDPPPASREIPRCGFFDTSGNSKKFTTSYC